jgi:hypothetical protein
MEKKVPRYGYTNWGYQYLFDDQVLMAEDN